MSAGGWERRESGALAAWTQRLLWVQAGVALLTMAMAWLRGFDPDAVSGPEAILLVLQFLLFLVCAVVTLRWIYVANVNARAMGASDMMVSPGWAAGWFFVPLMNLFMPFVMMRELWKASSRPSDWQMEAASPAILGWWVLWIASGVFGVISFATALEKAGAQSAELFVFASDAAFAGAALLLAWIVGRIQAMQGSTAPTAVFA